MKNNNIYIIKNLLWFFDLLKSQKDIWRFEVIIYTFANYLREDSPFYKGNPLDINNKKSSLLSEIFSIFFEIIYDYRISWRETWQFMELTYKKEKILHFSEILQNILEKYLKKEEISYDLEILKNDLKKFFLENTKKV